MKKIIFFFAMIAFVVSANANPISLVNNLNCDVDVTIWAHNSACTGFTCKQYSATVTVPANTTINYTAPNDMSLVNLWMPTPCTFNPATMSTSNYSGTITSCGWTFDLGPCTSTFSSSGTCTGCTTSGTVHATLGLVGTTITLTLS